MKFRKSKGLNLIEKTAGEFGAQLSSAEYATLSYMNLAETDLRLIFIYEFEKSKMLENRREQDEFNRELRREKEREKTA